MKFAGAMVVRLSLRAHPLQGRRLRSIHKSLGVDPLDYLAFPDAKYGGHGFISDGSAIRIGARET
jgi:hypothetical protein